MEKRYNKKLDKVVSFLEKFIARVEKGTVAKDKKVIEESYVTIIFFVIWKNDVLLPYKPKTSRLQRPRRGPPTMIILPFPLLQEE